MREKLNEDAVDILVDWSNKRHLWAAPRAVALEAVEALSAAGLLRTGEEAEVMPCLTPSVLSMARVPGAIAGMRVGISADFDSDWRRACENAWRMADEAERKLEAIRKAEAEKPKRWVVNRTQDVFQPWAVSDRDNYEVIVARFRVEADANSYAAQKNAEGK